MPDDLIRLTATEAVARLKRREISPLELIDAAAARIAAVEPAVNALPTLCLDRARDHARRLMDGQGRGAEGEAGWLGGLPVSIKDLTDVADVRTTYGSPIFKDHVPVTSHPLVQRIERKGGIVVAKSNTPEFGAGGSTFNEVFGRTRNPWQRAWGRGIWWKQGQNITGPTPSTRCRFGRTPPASQSPLSRGKRRPGPRPK